MAAKQTKERKIRLPSREYDAVLLLPVIFLVGVGVVMVYSASSALALKAHGSDYYYLKKQAIFACVGIAALVCCRHFPYRLYRSLVYPILFLSIGLLIAVQIPGVGHTAGGATRWLRLGPVSFQPSELAKFAMVLYMAYSMSKKGELLKDFYVGFLPHMLILGIFTALIFPQPDVGSVLIIVAITWMMMFLGGVRFIHLFSPLLILAPVMTYFVIQEPYRWQRIIGFLDPWRRPADIGYQLIHSLMAFGSGGAWGTGLGNSHQKLFYLPEPHTDFIYSVIGEELGLVGVLAVLLLYALILWRGLLIANRASDSFGSFMAAGLTAAIIMQVCINMGVTLGLLPTKGLTLPFLSYGGTSLLINMASVGVIMNIAASGGPRKDASEMADRTRRA
ncbi:MAG: putative lipid II flippase FtsW [Desulfobacterales bacterium]|nr:putative lipid II flippase FtsW [Desulfobacterales bacterium]